MSTTDRLIEIGTEELPPIALPVLSRAFTEGFRDQLKTNGIGFETIESFAAPRRLALLKWKGYRAGHRFKEDKLVLAGSVNAEAAEARPGPR